MVDIEVRDAALHQRTQLALFLRDKVVGYAKVRFASHCVPAVIWTTCSAISRADLQALGMMLSRVAV